MPEKIDETKTVAPQTTPTHTTATLDDSSLQIPTLDDSNTHLPTKRDPDLRDPSTEIQKPLKRLYTVAKLMDSQFKVPVVGSVGIDPILGLVPVVGDVTTYLVSTYIIVQAGRMGIPPKKILLMSGHALVDALIGYIPVAGDFIDVAYKANSRNVNIILDHFDAHIDPDGNFQRFPVQPPQFTTKAKVIIWCVVIGVLILLLIMIAIPILLIYWIFSN